jgi:serine protease
LPTVTPAPGFVAWGYGEREKGYRYAYINWSGSTAAGFDVRRDGKKVATVFGANDYTDELGKGGNQTFTYRVCETGSETCTDGVPVNF